MSIYYFFKKLNSYIPKFIRRNFGRKAIALAFALLVYFKVSNQLGEESIITNIPVNITAYGSVEVLAYAPTKITITVKGSKNKIRLLTASDINIDLKIDKSILKNRNFSPYKPIMFKIDQSDITLPGNINIVKIAPEEIAVHLDTRATKIVKVVPVYKGTLPKDFVKGEIKVIPNTVSITGPRSIIKQIKSLMTQPILLDKTTVGSFQVDKDFQDVDKDILISPKSVQINVEIYKANGTRVFNNIPISILTGDNKVDSKIKLSQNYVNITLWGLNSHLEMLSRNSIRAFADISKFNKPGIYEAKIDCWLKDSALKVKFIEPSYLKVEILK
ncbi:MAG TPA: CdaR family protein [Victivallales bacterium]|nr:CdaR family protein [Victivallales bacterium]